MASDQESADHRTASDMQAVFQQTNAVMALEGFEKNPAMESLQAAVLAGRATLNEVVTFALLEAKITGARSTLAALGATDARYAVISQRLDEHVEKLRAMAINMGGAVRVTHGL